MGIKTKFNPMGGKSEGDDELALWRYSNDVISGKTLLYNYRGSDWDNTLKVPTVNGNSIINDWYDASTSSTTDSNRNTPFYNNPNVKSVDLQKVPFSNNSMYYAFYNCQNLTSVTNINNSVTNMAYTFSYCSNLNQNIQIPSSVTSMSGTFSYCSNLNQNIQIPSSVTSMSGTFYSCDNLNQNIQIPSSVTNMSAAFTRCYNFNQNIQIPSSVTNMSSTFYGCDDLNQNIRIPSSVTSMDSTFVYCCNLNQNIQIPNSVTSMSSTFRDCYKFNQNIQIPNSVTSMASAFSDCYNLNQNIQIPSSATNMSNTFADCRNLNQNIQIPSSVTDMSYTFADCYNLSRRVDVLTSNLSNSYKTFWGTSLPKDVYIYYKYANGVYTKTYNLVVLGNATGGSVSNLNYVWHGQNGVTVHDLNLRTLTVTTSPSTATCNLYYDGSYHVTKSATVNNGTVVQYNVTSTNYYPNTGSWTITSDTTKTVTLTSSLHTVTVTTSPSDATCILTNANGTSVTAKSMTINDNAYVNYNVYKTGYTANNGQWYISSNITKSVTLEEDPLINWRYSNDVISGKTLLYNYKGSDWGNTLKVPTVSGNSIINDWRNLSTSGTTDSNRNTPFYNNPNVKSVDLQKVPFRNNSMYKAFYNCQNLISVTNINNSVTDMYDTFHRCVELNQNIQIPSSVTNMNDTFYYCLDLNQNIQIPSSVTDMSHTFASCTNLNQNIQIPNSVTDMSSTFYYCNKLNQNIQIPSSVTNMAYTFNYCTNLNQNIQIPSSVTSMTGTFSSCFNLNQNIQIPNSVTSMSNTFNYCTNLNQNIQIPNSVTDMSSTFYYCNNMSKFINIYSAEISNAINGFYRNNSSAAIPNVAIPSRYINNAVTNTWKSLNTAGWKITNEGATVVAYSKIVGWDFIGGDYTYTGNGTHWILSEWNGKMSGNPTTVTVPATITTYDTFPTALNYPCFQANTSLTKIDCNNVPYTGTTMINAFRGCSELTEVSNLSIPEGITTLNYAFYQDSKLSKAFTTGRTASVGEVNIKIPNSVTALAYTFGNCKSIGNFNLNNGFGVTTLTGTFDYCNTKPLNIRIDSPNVSTVTYTFRGNVSTYRKNIYIYFKYKNGVATATFNAFKAAIYMGTSGNSTFANPSYNSTSNYYFYNIGTCPV